MEGKLRKNGNDRWEIVVEGGDCSRIELTSGDVVEIKVCDHWIRTSIESQWVESAKRSEYYSTAPGTKLYQGQSARY